MLPLDAYQSQLPAEGFPVIRDIESTGSYLTRRDPVKGLFCFKPTAREQALQQATLKSRDSTLLLPLPTRGLGHVFPVLVLRVIPRLCWELIIWLRCIFSLCIIDKRINCHATSAVKLSPTRCHLLSLFPANRASPILRTTAENIQRIESESINELSAMVTRLCHQTFQKSPFIYSYAMLNYISYFFNLTEYSYRIN